MHKNAKKMSKGINLQKFCVNKIVENFDRLCKFFSSEDVIFLQRNYSEDIIKKLQQSDGKIKEEYVDLLITNELNSLSSEWLENCPWDKIIRKMAQIGPNIKKMKFSFSDDDDERLWNEIFFYLPNLEAVTHHHTCTDEILSGIASYCPNIKKIELCDNITDERFKNLAKNGSCSKLKILVIHARRLSEDTAKHLIKNLPSLEVLECHLNLPKLIYSVYHEHLPTMNMGVPLKLTELDFTGVEHHYDDILKTCLILCPQLKSLVCQIRKPQHFNLICELSNLEKLHIDNIILEDDLDVNDFLKSKGSKLTSLKLTRCLVSLRILAESCPFMNELHFVKVNVEWGETSIPPFENLNALLIDVPELRVRGKILKSACFILTSSRKLKVVLLNNCLTPEVKAAFLKCCEQNALEKILLGGSRVIEERFVKDIYAACHSLLCFRLDARSLEEYDVNWWFH